MTCLHRIPDSQVFAILQFFQPPGNGHGNAERNPNQNQETIVPGLFSKIQMKTDEEQWFPDSSLDFVLHSDGHFGSYVLRNRLYPIGGGPLHRALCPLVVRET